MFLSKFARTGHWFEVMESAASQPTNVMNFEPGDASASGGDPASDQVLLVVEGELIAQVAEERARMTSGHMVLIPAGVSHRFENTGPGPARALSVFASPVYSSKRWK